MAIGHEKLDGYRLSITYVAWVFEKADSLSGIHRTACDQWLRGSQSIPLDIAEGNGKTAEADRRRYFEIARGSALECAAIQDVLVIGKVLAEIESRERKVELIAWPKCTGDEAEEAIALRKTWRTMDMMKSISIATPKKPTLKRQYT